MYLVSQDFIDNAKKHGRLLDIRLSFDGEVISGEKVSKLEKDFEATMLATASQQITGEVVGRYDLTDSVIRVEIGIAYNESPFSYVDYGFFIVKEHDRIVGAKGSQDKTTFVAYDIMLNAHELYDVDKLGVNYPISVFNLYKAIATYIGTEVSETNVVNGNMMIEEDKYTNIENVTYRNVLDDLSATMGASIIVSKNKLLAKYANVGVNLIKNDFSDFTAYQGATVTKNKTFPIDVFKGGRNYFRINGNGSYGSYNTIPTVDGNRLKSISTSTSSTTWAINSRLWSMETGVIYFIEMKIKKNGRALLPNEVPTHITTRSPQGNFDGTYDAETFTYRVSQTGNNDVYWLHAQFGTKEIGDELEIWDITYKKVADFDYSPAPEDGYGYTGDDGAYHIETSGGNHLIKYLLSKGTQENNVNYIGKVVLHAFSNFITTFNSTPLSFHRPTINETSTIEQEYEGNGVNSLQVQFRANNIADSLDFIASDPFIGLAIPQYPAQSTEVSNVFNPISQVQVYWDDASAFEVGTDIGSTIVINTPWATQSSTDYIHSILNGYQYIPAQGTRVYADPAIQLGDTFSYGDITQLVAEVVWSFDGAVTADFNAPQNNDYNFDDPQSILMQNEFKKKISLGDSYQGVSIGRQDGIQMLLSPDGSEENAIGRYYANLNEGMAFQTRDTIMSPWQNWLYFDMQEKVFKLSLYSTTEEDNQRFTAIEADLDSINATVSNISFGNLLSNGSGEMGFVGWIGGSTARYVTPLIRYIEGLTYSMGFIPQANPLALSETELSFYSDGFDVSPVAFIVPDMDHSYRAKIMRFKPFNIDVLEFNSIDNANDMVVNKTTKFTFNTSVAYAEFTFTPSTSTQYVRFKYNRTGISPTDRLSIAEVMFNRGLPKSWQLSPLNAIIYSQSTRVQLSDRITDTVTKIEVVDGKTVSNKSMIDQQANQITSKVSKGEVVSSINQSAETIAINASKISLEGIITANGNVKIFEDGSIEVNKGKFKGEIDTDNRVRVGTYIGMPLVKVQNVSEWVENAKIGKGGIFWSEDGSSTNIGASIMVNEFIGSVDAFGKRMQLKADNISIIGDEGFQIIASGNVGNSFGISAGKNNNDSMHIHNYDSSISIYAATGFRADTDTGDMRFSTNGGNVMLFGDKLLVGLGGFKEVEFYLDSGGDVKWRNT